ncbi:MAG: hypothetical protein COB67_04155, partial [SAR324 cluster bacterium]
MKNIAIMYFFSCFALIVKFKNENVSGLKVLCQVLLGGYVVGTILFLEDSYITILLVHGLMSYTAIYWGYNTIKMLKNKRNSVFIKLVILIWFLAGLILQIAYVNEMLRSHRILPLALIMCAMIYTHILVNQFMEKIREKEKVALKIFELSAKLEAKKQALIESKRTLEEYRKEISKRDKLLEQPKLNKALFKIKKKIEL